MRTFRSVENADIEGSYEWLTLFLTIYPCQDTCCRRITKCKFARTGTYLAVTALLLRIFQTSQTLWHTDVKMAATKSAVERVTTHQQDDLDDLKPISDVREVQGDARFYETVTAAPLDPRSRASIQLYLILLVAALNATTSGFDGVSTPQGTKNIADSSHTHAVHFQLDQCYDAVQGLFPSHGARLFHWHVSQSS